MISKKRINNLRNLEIFKVDNRNFTNYWNLFLNEYSQYSYRYDLDYCAVEQSQIINNFIDESFVVSKDNIPLAICPLTIDLDKKYIWYFQGHPMPSPLIYEKLDFKQIINLEDFIFEIIKEKINKYDLKRYYIESDALSFVNRNYFDLFSDRIGSIDMSFNCRIVKLNNSKEELWSQIRNSYKNIINRSLKKIDFLVYDQNNFDGDPKRIYQKLHFKTSGRQTRSSESFDKMNQLIKKNKALLFVQKIKNKIAQMEIVVLGKNTACGASVADDPDIDFELPLTHSMNYFICLELMQRNYRFFDIGQTDYVDNLFQPLSEKNININFFKRGFGMKNTPHRRWVWFINKNEEFVFYKEQLKLFKQLKNI